MTEFKSVRNINGEYAIFMVVKTDVPRERGDNGKEATIYLYDGPIEEEKSFSYSGGGKYTPPTTSKIAHGSSVLENSVEYAVDKAMRRLIQSLEGRIEEKRNELETEEELEEEFKSFTEDPKLLGLIEEWEEEKNG